MTIMIMILHKVYMPVIWFVAPWRSCVVLTTGIFSIYWPTFFEATNPHCSRQLLFAVPSEASVLNVFERFMLLTFAAWRKSMGVSKRPEWQWDAWSMPQMTPQPLDITRSNLPRCCIQHEKNVRRSASSWLISYVWVLSANTPYVTGDFVVDAHCSQVKLALWQLKKTATRLFVYRFVQVNKKESIRVPHFYIGETQR